MWDSYGWKDWPITLPSCMIESEHLCVSSDIVWPRTLPDTMQ